MHVLHLLPTFDAGGLGSLGLELVRAWEPGDVHTVMGSRFSGTQPTLRRSFEALVGSERVREIPRHMLYPMSFVDSLRDTARAFGPFDAALIYNWFDHVWYTMGLRRSGHRGPIFCHVGTVVPTNDMTRRMFDSPFTRDVRFIPASAAVAYGLTDAGAKPGFVEDPVWNGVNLSEFPIATRAAPTALEDALAPVVFGFTGRMAPDAKDFDALIRGYAKLSGAARARACLVLAGDGPKRREFEALALALGLSVQGDGEPTPGAVSFTGLIPRERVSGFLCSLDVFVMAALPIEGMSMALVEAIVSGLPIIATDVPSNREILTGVGVGRLVSGADGIAQAMEWLATDDEARARLAAKSASVRDLFSVSRTALAYRELFARAHGRASRGESPSSVPTPGRASRKKAAR